MPDKKVIAELEVQTGRSKQNLHEVTEELSGQGDAAVKNAGRITAALDGVEEATARVIKKEQEGKVVTERDGKAAIQNYERLKEAIKDAFGALENAPEKTKAAFATATSQYELATKKIRENTDAIQDNSEKLKEGGGRYAGIGETINKAIGPLGKYQVGLIGIAAAFKEGWLLGTQFATAIGTNFSALESATANLKKSLAGVTSALTTDGFGAAIEQAKASIKFFGDSTLNAGKALEGYNTLVSLGIDRAKALAASQDDLKRITDAHTLAVQGGSEALKQFNSAITTFDPHTAADYLENLTAHFKELAVREQEAAREAKSLKDAEEASITTINNLIQALRNEIQARKDGTAAVEEEIDKYKVLHDELKKNAAIQTEQEKDLGGVTLSMHVLLSEIDKLIPAYEQHEKRIKNAAAALKQLLETNESLSPEEKKRIEQIEEQIERYDELTPAQKQILAGMIDQIVQSTKAAAAAEAHAAGMGELTTSTEAAAEAHGKINVVIKDGKKVIENTTEEVKKSNLEWDSTNKTLKNVEGAHKSAKGTLTDFGNSVGSQKQVIIDYNSQLDSMDKHLIDIAQHAREAAEALNHLGSAANAAAGDAKSTATSYPNVNEETPTPGSVPKPPPTPGTPGLGFGTGHD